MLRFARHYFCVELERRGRRFVRFNFGEVLKCGDGGKEFERLPVEDVIEILGDDDLNVRSEEAVFEAVQKWVEHDIAGRAHHLPDLLKVVRMGNLSAEYLTYSVLQWPPIDADNECKSLIGDVFKLMDSAPKDATLGHHPQLRPRVPHDILFAVGGWTAGSPTNFIETYDTRADRWLLSRDNDLVPRAYHGICTLDGLIYMIGGFDGNEHFNTVRCFDPATHLWKDCACMYYPRCYVSVAVHGGRIYAMGGYNGRIRMSSAERYDPQVNQWQQIQPMQRQRSDASAAALDDKIYIVGGFNGTEVMNSAEVYDTLTNQWSFIPHMISARSGVSLVAFKDTLYALGGFNGFTRLTSGEKYSPNFHHHCSSSNNNNSIGGGGLGVGGEWVQIAEMFSPRSNFATVILDEYIFVIGGFNDRFVAGSTTINYVECYDSEANEWFDAAPMNLNRSALSACVISGLQNAKDYSLLGRSVSELGQGASGCQAQQDTITAATTTPAP
ncbi:PREDICTED: kelch-like protein 10 isoform X2 [Nicrophorus vespilloides]|uniref:Kelch-like protein 10 isoform X2 n=1 Tax=Nicrophorus vespilloides TaxID=110193 RepID=A0ABM1MHF3_NICVS|nr:PREDICTED: kelch-like protein 10 isoform X2 [Nicrophorus vespilloides]